MSTHTHLVTLDGDDPVGTFLHPLHTGFARWWNIAYGGLGPVFAERPKSIVMNGTERLAILVAYVHNNPGRAGVADDPADSDWTSHRAFIGQQARSTA